MLVHLGGGTTVDSSRLMMLTDLQKALAPATQGVVDRLSRQGRIRRLPGRAATLILCEEKGRLYGIYSPIGLRTLRQRVQPPLNCLDP